MPWITVTTAPDVIDAASGSRLAAELADVAAEAVGLAPGDVIVLVQTAVAAAGRGALVWVAGRRRDDTVERNLEAGIRAVVARGIGSTDDLVGVVRL